jgi:hypothetical protein
MNFKFRASALNCQHFVLFRIGLIFFKNFVVVVKTGKKFADLDDRLF